MYFKCSTCILILLLFVLTNSKAKELALSENLNEISKEKLEQRYKTSAIELFFLKDRTMGCARDQSGLVQAIKQQDFNTANQLIETDSHGMTETDWKSIFKQIVDTDSEAADLISAFGQSMNFGTDKLMFYFINNEEIYWSDHTKLQMNLVDSFSDLFNILSSYHHPEKEASIKILYDIEWDKLIEYEIDVLMNEALAKSYSELNLSQLLYNLDDDEFDSESSTVFKIFFIGSLKQVIEETENNENTFLFKLAFNIRDRIENVEYTKGYLVNYLKQLLDSFHGCIRSIVNEPNGNGFLIQSVKYGEFLHTDLLGINWDKNETNVKDFLPLFSSNISVIDQSAQFYVEGRNEHLNIRSGYYPERYIDLLSETYAYVYGSGRLVVIIPSDRDNENCYIQRGNNKYMYAGMKKQKKGLQGRIIFSDGKKTDRNSSYLWKFTSFKILEPEYVITKCDTV